MKNFKTIVEKRKDKFVKGGIILLTSCIGGFIGARLGLNNSRFEINLFDSNGSKLGTIK